MWRSTASEPTEAAETTTWSPGGRRPMSLFRGGKQSTGGSKGTAAVEPESPSVFKKLLEARNDADAQRSPEEHAMQRRKKKWHMVKKALATTEDGDKALHEAPESSSSLRSLSGGSVGSNVFVDQRQTKVVFHQFSSANPKEVMHIEREDSVPSPETRSHVVVRVQVRSPARFRRCQSLACLSGCSSRAHMHSPCFFCLLIRAHVGSPLRRHRR